MKTTSSGRVPERQSRKIVV